MSGHPWGSDNPIRLGISSCLLGEPVRFDGGHKRDAFLTDVLGAFVEWVPVCPEVEIGLPTPRDTIRLEGDHNDPRLVVTKTDNDITMRMKSFSTLRVEQLEKADLCGYVLKKGSPSCGLHRVRVYNESGMPSSDGHGLYASALVAGMPSLPVEEEGRLHDPALRENFVERIFAFRRLKDLLAAEPRPRDVVAFHTAHKLQLMSHSPVEYRALGRLVAEAGSPNMGALITDYSLGFMRALAAPATRSKNTDVLQHCLGHFKKLLDRDVRADLARTVEDYRCGLTPLVVPITLLAHYVKRAGVEYLAGQTYLEPHPKEMMLRNHG